MTKLLSSSVSPSFCGGIQSAPPLTGEKERFSAAQLAPSSDHGLITNSLLTAVPAGFVQKAPGHLLPRVGHL